MGRRSTAGITRGCPSGSPPAPPGGLLGLDRSFNVNWLEINDRVYPYFERVVVEEDETNQVIRDELGVLLRQQKHFKSIPEYIRFPVQNEADYDALLPRLNGQDPGRYAEDFDEDLHWRRAAARSSV